MPSTLPSPLEAFDALCQRLRGRTPLLCLDFDGTLTEIVDHPDDARLTPSARDLLARLATRCPVALISGRALNDLRTRVALPALYYAGNHGLEIAGPEGSGLAFRGPAASSALARAGEYLRAEAPRFPGLLVEDKGMTLSVHYRRVAATQWPAVAAAVQRATAGIPDLVIRHGKAVHEIRPAGATHKGTAVNWLMAQLAETHPHLHALCIGDDLTDEDAFGAVAGHGDAILVGAARPTAATWRLEDPGQVHELLSRIVEELSGGT